MIPLFDFDGFAIVCTDLNRQGLVLGQNINTVEAGFLGDTVDLVEASGDFVLDRGRVVGTVGAVGRYPVYRRLVRMLEEKIQIFC